MQDTIVPTLQAPAGWHGPAAAVRVPAGPVRRTLAILRGPAVAQ